jgi:hypothetical protein
MVDLSTTAGSNSPSGSDNLSTADDYLRALSAITKAQVSTGAAITAAATITPDGSGQYYVVSGSTGITAIASTNSWNGRVIYLKFSSAPIITHNATSLILPGGSSITAAAGDVAGFVQESSGNWRCIFYQYASGVSPAPFVDSTAIAKGSSDSTKQVRFEVDGITTATTRVMTVPDVDLTIGSYNIPQTSKSANYTFVLADANTHILHPSADTTARTFTIPANASVAYPVGTVLTFVNQHSAGTVTISINSDTMRLAGAGTTGSRTLAADGIATALKIDSTNWIISGTNLT